jgi:hypothetical protein
MVWPQDRDAGSIISGQPADSGVRDGNVPSRSCLITVPVPLLSMWIDEAHKLLQPTHFAIIPYETQSREVSATTWDQLYTSAVGKCNGNPLAVIVIATTKVSCMYRRRRGADLAGHRLCIMTSPAHTRSRRRTMAATSSVEQAVYGLLSMVDYGPPHFTTKRILPGTITAIASTCTARSPTCPASRVR